MISNRGGPTVLDRWQLKVRFKDGTILQPSAMAPLAPGLRFEVGPELGFESDDWWTFKAAANPLVRGGGASGWIYAIFHDLPLEEFWNKNPSMVILSVTDVNGKPWTFETPVEGMEPPPIPQGEFITIDTADRDTHEGSEIHRRQAGH